MKLPFEGQRQWTLQHWEDEDYVICQYGDPVGQTVSQKDGKMIIKWLETQSERPSKKIKCINKYVHDLRDDWECPKCKCKYTKQAGDCPAGRWWTECAGCGKKLH